MTKIPAVKAAAKVAVEHKTRSKPVSRSKRAKLTLPVGRIHRILRERHLALHISASASVYLAAVLEYLTAEILELASHAAETFNRSRISPRHIMLAIRKDVELNKMLAEVVIAGSGVMPYIAPELLPKRAVRDNDQSQGKNVSSQEY